MKRRIFMGLAVITVMAAIAGCGHREPDSSQSSSHQDTGWTVFRPINPSSEER
ncbi:hypothetical protein ACFOLF_21475 [Paenibacillus sepulcri]|uniref:Lipoprotein n=1 Tax=Paenibacillus sepulcri TaxID=359917 RepID=A0ABS7C0Y9_9BACL|nr:hypothetical protein [Paenibacillus sepulcri]